MSNKMSKMDRTAVRRPIELEQKYSFEKQFTETRAVAEEAKKIASSVNETENGLSLEVEALNNDINGANGVKAKLDLKVEMDDAGNLQSEVHVQGNKFTVEADNFKLRKDGSVEMTGKLSTSSGNSSTTIDGGRIYIDCTEHTDVTESGVVLTKIKHRVLTFNGFDGSTYAVNACGILLKQTGELSYSGLEIEKVDETKTVTTE